MSPERSGVVQLNGGQRLRALRETLGYRMRDVELASNQIAQRFDSEEFAIPPSRLSDIETKGIIPSIFRLYSFAAIYRREYRELLSLLWPRTRWHLGGHSLWASAEVAPLRSFE